MMSDITPLRALIALCSSQRHHSNYSVAGRIGRQPHSRAIHAKSILHFPITFFAPRQLITPHHRGIQLSYSKTMPSSYPYFSMHHNLRFHMDSSERSCRCMSVQTSRPYPMNPGPKGLLNPLHPPSLDLHHNDVSLNPPVTGNQLCMNGPLHSGSLMIKGGWSNGRVLHALKNSQNTSSRSKMLQCLPKLAHLDTRTFVDGSLRRREYRSNILP